MSTKSKPQSKKQQTSIKCQIITTKRTNSYLCSEQQNRKQIIQDSVHQKLIEAAQRIIQQRSKQVKKQNEQKNAKQSQIVRNYLNSIQKRGKNRINLRQLNYNKISNDNFVVSDESFQQIGQQKQLKQATIQSKQPQRVSYLKKEKKLVQSIVNVNDQSLDSFNEYSDSVTQSIQESFQSDGVQQIENPNKNRSKYKVESQSSEFQDNQNLNYRIIKNRDRMDFSEQNRDHSTDSSLELIIGATDTINTDSRIVYDQVQAEELQAQQERMFLEIFQEEYKRVRKQINTALIFLKERINYFQRHATQLSDSSDAQIQEDPESSQSVQETNRKGNPLRKKTLKNQVKIGKTKIVKKISKMKRKIFQEQKQQFTKYSKMINELAEAQVLQMVSNHYQTYRQVSTNVQKERQILEKKRKGMSRNLIRKQQQIAQYIKKLHPINKKRKIIKVRECPHAKQLNPQYLKLVRRKKMCIKCYGAYQIRRDREHVNLVRNMLKTSLRSLNR